MISFARPFPAPFPARFAPGVIVQHRRYAYRGVVVAIDRRCNADEAWYQSNATQPAREQPWYHVLVHRSPHCTYAADENLQPDPTAEPIVHPWIDHFFSAFADGRYVRNERPWPE